MCAWDWVTQNLQWGTQLALDVNTHLLCAPAGRPVALLLSGWEEEWAELRHTQAQVGRGRWKDSVFTSLLGDRAQEGRGVRHTQLPPEMCELNRPVVSSLACPRTAPLTPAQ